MTCILLYDATPYDDGLPVTAEGVLLLGLVGFAAGALAVSAVLAAGGWLLHHWRR